MSFLGGLQSGVQFGQQRDQHQQRTAHNGAVLANTQAKGAQAQQKADAERSAAGMKILQQSAQYARSLPLEGRAQGVKAYLQNAGVPDEKIAEIESSGVMADMSDQRLDAFLNSTRQEQVLKDKEMLVGRDGKAVISNRYNAPQVVSDGSALVGQDGQELYSNTKDAAPTADIQNFQLAKQGGFEGSFVDYQTAIKQAGRSQTNVNVGKGENAFDVETGKLYAKRNQSIVSSAQGARSKLNRLNEMELALQNPDVYTGAGGEAVQKARRIGLALGLDISEEAVADGDLVNALGNQLALSMRSTSDGEGMPGQLSDRDIQFLTSSVPNLDKTREGNLKLIGYARKVEQRKIDVEKWRQEYAQMNNGRLDNGFEQYVRRKAEENPLFSSPDANATVTAEPKTDDKAQKFTENPDGSVTWNP